ncbi:MAG: hypothetical protein AAGC49_02385 [Brevundimonas sp.]
MWNDPLWNLAAARDELDAASRHLRTAGAVPWTGGVAGPFRVAVDGLLGEVSRLRDEADVLVQHLGCRP